MPDPLVETKLLPPRLRPRSVDRPRLLDHLSDGASARLTLVSAPAGFGKTTLVTSWLDGRRPPGRSAWVSLDARDTDATTYWTYLLHAVDRAAPGSASAALDQLRTGRAVEPVLAALLNELSVLPEDLTIVLDDYHLADGPGIHQGMEFLLGHLPPQVHLVISTRVDPALPLPRLRARGDLVEIRAADLRFTPDEAASYLGQVHGLDLDGADVALLEGKTEGWAAALQLAALSLRGHAAPAEFIAGFAGTDRFVVDYLADEVLERQPAQTRTFLLATSVLDRLTGSLCDAVTGGTGSHRTLAALERSNLFVVGLDEERRWYRYHHLFADVLRAHLSDERPDDVATLHGRASRWFAEHEDPERAVTHALAAGDVDRAADLVELAIPALRRRRRESVLRRWADELPARVVVDRPVLAVGFVHAFTSCNDFDGVEQRLADVERLMAAAADTHVVVDRQEYGRVPGAISTNRAALRLVAGDLAGTVSNAELALVRAAPSDLLTRAAASALIGIAAWTVGDLTGAHEGYTAAADGLARAGHVSDVLGCTITLVDLEITQGRLRQAQGSVERALRRARQGGELPGDRAVDPPRGTADMHVALSRIAWERGDLQAAAAHLQRAGALGDDAGLPQNPYRWRVALARLREAGGDRDGAVELLHEARRLYLADYAPEVRPVAADLARMLATRGDVDEGTALLDDLGVSADDDVTYLREYAHLTLARVLLARHDRLDDRSALSRATGLLQRLLAAAESAGRWRSVLETMPLLARARLAAGDRRAALELVDRAGALAQPEGFLGVFTLDGPYVVDLVAELVDRRPERPFLRRIEHTIRAQSQCSAASPPPLVEPLSERELDVLRHLCSELDGPAIARELSVSLSTVRTHTQHIYTKLGVSSRRAAVRRAHQFDLLTRRR